MTDSTDIIIHYRNKEAQLSGAETLSIFITRKEFAYAVLDPEKKSLLELCHLNLSELQYKGQSEEQKLSHILSNYRLTRTYKNVNIAFLHPDFTMIPGSFSDGKFNRSYLEFVTGKTDEAISAHQLGNILFQYFVPSETAALFERNFRNCNLRHAGAISIDLLMNNRVIKKHDIFIVLHLHHFEIAAKRNEELCFYNTYDLDSIEDVLYFLSLMAEQFSFEPSSCKIIIGGQTEVNSQLVQLLKKYFRNIAFAVHAMAGTDEKNSPSIPDHYYVTLLSQHLCAL